VERRRRFSVEQKLAILTEATIPGANLSEVGRRHGLLPAQVYKWRRFAELGVIGVPGASELPSFVAVEIAKDVPPLPTPVHGDNSPAVNDAPRRRRRCSTIRLIGLASTRGHFWRSMPDLSARCLWRLHQAVGSRPQAGSIGRGGVLGPCPPPFFILADAAANARRKAHGKTASPISPMALEAVHRIDTLFNTERSINVQAERRRTVRRELGTRLVADLEQWLREQRSKLLRGNDLAKAIDYMLKR
jgi:transposase-like protein